MKTIEQRTKEVIRQLKDLKEKGVCVKLLSENNCCVGVSGQVHLLIKKSDTLEQVEKGIEGTYAKLAEIERKKEGTDIFKAIKEEGLI